MKMKKTNLKIIAASCVAIFSLATAIGGAYAWFSLTMSTTVTADEFAVVNNGQCGMYSINLIKFDYPTLTYGSGDYIYTTKDYLNPQAGDVNKYGYSKEHNSFGYVEDETWHEVDVMNTYDPIDKIIFSSTLKDLNCNAVYEFTVNTTEFTSAYLEAIAAKLSNISKEAEDIFLTSCVNYDIYLPSELSDSNPVFTDGEGHKLYYPSYIDESETLSTNEEIYYKISYLASLEASHAHFFGTSYDEITIDNNVEVEFVYSAEANTNLLTFYVNVDYDPDQLEYTQTMIYQGNIHAVFDYMFRFTFTEREADQP